MSYIKNKAKLKSIFLQVRSANWTLRAYGRAIERSFTKRQKGGFARFGAILLSLLFFHFFPFVVVSSYMSWEGFFSYDMFRDGVSGVTAFYWWTEFFLVIGSAYIFGFIYFFVESKIKKNVLPFRSVLFWVVLGVNFFIIFLIVYFSQYLTGSFTGNHLAWLCMIAAWVMLHIGIVFNASGKAALFSLAFGVTLLTTVAIIHPGTLALPYSLSLQFFGNGGGLPAKLKIKKHDLTIRGKLVLASPENIYIYIQKGSDQYW